MSIFAWVNIETQHFGNVSRLIQFCELFSPEFSPAAAALLQKFYGNLDLTRFLVLSISEVGYPQTSD